MLSECEGGTVSWRQGIAMRHSICCSCTKCKGVTGYGLNIKWKSMNLQWGEKERAFCLLISLYQRIINNGLVFINNSFN